MADDAILSTEQWVWPEWVPEPNRQTLLAFWNGTPGRRFPEDWLRMCSDMNGPSFGVTLPAGVLMRTAGGPAPAGRFLYGWGNLGVIVPEEGRPAEVWFVCSGEYHWQEALSRARTSLESYQEDVKRPPAVRASREADEALRHYFCTECVGDLLNRGVGLGSFDCLWHGLRAIGIERDMLREHLDEMQRVIGEAVDGGRCIPVTVEIMGFSNIKFFEGKQPTDEDHRDPRQNVYRVPLCPKPGETSTTIELRGGRWIRISAWSGVAIGGGPACGHERRRMEEDERHAKAAYYQHAELKHQRDETWRFKDLYVAAVLRVHQNERHPGPQSHIRECEESGCLAVRTEMTRPYVQPPAYEEVYPS